MADNLERIKKAEKGWAYNRNRDGAGRWRKDLEDLEMKIMGSAVLWNDCENAQACSDFLKETARQLCNAASVEKGDTNHSVNDICNSIYSDTISMLEAYHNAAEADANKITKIANTLFVEDAGMAASLETR